MDDWTTLTPTSRTLMLQITTGRELINVRLPTRIFIRCRLSSGENEQQRRSERTNPIRIIVSRLIWHAEGVGSFYLFSIWNKRGDLNLNARGLFSPFQKMLLCFTRQSSQRVFELNEKPNWLLAVGLDIGLAATRDCLVSANRSLKAFQKIFQ